MTFAILSGLTLSLGFGCSQTDFNASGNLRKGTDQNSSMDGTQNGNQNIGDYGSLGDIDGGGGRHYRWYGWHGRLSDGSSSSETAGMDGSGTVTGSLIH